MKSTQLVIILIVSLTLAAIYIKPGNCGDYEKGYLESMTIDIKPGENRPYVYSGYGSCFFYGTTASEAFDGHMGYYVGEDKLFDDFQVYLDDRRLLRSEAEIEFKPHESVFRWGSGELMTIVPLYRDNNFLQLSFKSPVPEKPIRFQLSLSSGMEYVDRAKGHVFLKPEKYSDELYFSVFSGEYANYEYNAQSSMLDVISDTNNLNLYIIYSTTLDGLYSSWDDVGDDPNMGLEDRKDWLLREINRSYFRCSNERINKAVNWMKISLASLWAENETALWAGFPWFNDCWGRDTFISVPGACLVQGKFSAAKNLIKRFAEWQNKDPESPFFGRIPNRARADDIVYNTTDGTPWFIREIYEYGLYSGDFDLWEEMLADKGTIRSANEGAVKYHIDNEGFLVHEEAETWMDAVGTDGAWSPRGNRAVDIQALWLAQLQASIRMADAVSQAGSISADLKKWKEITCKLKKNINEEYIRDDGLGLYDHLNLDGSKDSMIRPNQIFAMTVPLEPVFDIETNAKILETVRKNLVYPYGVASLSQHDPDFHPYHQYHLYPKDEAYHMGIVWTWLSGPFKSASKSGWIVAENEINLTLDHGAPGTMAEVLDAVPREGEQFPNLSGTVSQTWSLAEFIRTLYQDFIGIKPNYNTNLNNEWILTPHLPEEIGDFEVILHLRDVQVKLSVEYDEINVNLSFRRIGESKSNTVIHLFGIDGETIKVDNSETTKLVLERKEREVHYTDDNGIQRQYTLFLAPENNEDYLKPFISEDLKCLQPPSHVLLSGNEIKVNNPEAKTIANLSDPEFDDVGDGDYVYPTDANFKPGILDLTNFEVKQGADLVYFKLNFRNLSQPGWHPEYGFQLTFATIAINTQTGKGRSDVQRNSKWILDDGYKADRFIHVGGGIMVENAESDILCEHIPEGMDYLLGNIKKREISFAIPKKFLPGNPEDWKITVLVGAQDDHGGAGLGEFRNVEVEAGRWVGGGVGKGKTNVYDSLKYPKQN